MSEAIDCSVVGWLLELARNPGGVVRAGLPLGPVDGRTRERVLGAVAEADGGALCVWVHDGWVAFFGEGVEEPAEDEAVLLDFARACAVARRPLDPTAVAVMVPGPAVSTVRAILAEAEIAAAVGRRVERLVDRLTGRRARRPLQAAAEIASLAALWPVALPVLTTAAGLHLASRLAPPVPEVDGPAEHEANLLAHLLARTVPAYLGNAGVRLAVLRLPLPLVVGIRTGRSEATVRLAQGRIEVRNGIPDDADVILEGDVEPLLSLAAGSLFRELGSRRSRRD